MFDCLELFLYYIANAMVFVSEVGQRIEPGHPRRSPISGEIPVATPPKLFFKCFDEKFLESDAAAGGKSLHSPAHSVREINSCPYWSIRLQITLVAKPMAKGCVS